MATLAHRMDHTPHKLQIENPIPPLARDTPEEQDDLFLAN